MDNSIIAFARLGRKKADHLSCLLNMTPQVHYDYKLGILENVRYKELLSTDLGEYGGSNVHNPDIKNPIDEPFAQAPYHITVTVPPMAGVIMQSVR